MTAEQLIEQIDECIGPCDRICISCPEGESLKEIRNIVADLIAERDRYKSILETVAQWCEWTQICEKYHIDWKK